MFSNALSSRVLRPLTMATKQARIGRKAAEHFLDLVRDTDVSRMALEWNEGAVAIEKKKSDVLSFSQAGQNSLDVSKYEFWPAGNSCRRCFSEILRRTFEEGPSSCSHSFSISTAGSAEPDINQILAIPKFRVALQPIRSLRLLSLKAP